MKAASNKGAAFFMSEEEKKSGSNLSALRLCD
jgi:hypothetical protein